MNMKWLLSNYNLIEVLKTWLLPAEDKLLMEQRLTATALTIFLLGLQSPLSKRRETMRPR